MIYSLVPAEEMDPFLKDLTKPLSDIGQTLGMPER